jgi:hypothetical protein
MRESKNTTRIGYVNPNGQVVIRNTGKPGTDHNAKIYLVAAYADLRMGQTELTSLTASAQSAGRECPVFRTDAVARNMTQLLREP